MLETLKDKDTLCDLFISSLPEGYLYNDSLKPFVRGFLDVFSEVAEKIDKITLSYLNPDENSYFLDEFLTEYGLPNFIFPDVSTAEKKVFAISMMRLASTLNSQQDYENFMLSLGYNVKMYHLSSLIPNSGFPYGFPVVFSGSLTKKDKLTWLVYIETSGVSSNYNGLGSAFPIQFSPAPSDINFPKKILDFLKPCDIIFKYISLETKNLFGL
jgi:hypothetical protein